MWRFAIAAPQAENVRDEAEWTQSPFSQMLQGRDLLPRGRTTYGTPRAGRERFACVRLFSGGLLLTKCPIFLIPPEGLVCRGERVRALLQDSRIVGPRVACVPYASVSERSSTVATMLAGSGEWRI